MQSQEQLYHMFLSSVFVHNIHYWRCYFIGSAQLLRTRCEYSYSNESKQPPGRLVYALSLSLTEITSEFSHLCCLLGVKYLGHNITDQFVLK